jgi:ParB/RepB/Spo0J family partition protein
MKGQTLVVGQIQQVDISDLRIARWNARKTFDAAALEELRSSIKAHGIQVPLIIRVVSGACEIVAGHRRFHAALPLWENGDETFERLPCIVRDLDDDAAREIGLVDNLQREDVPPLEEADAYAELQGRLGTAAAIAVRVGKEAGYVAKRLQLVKLGANSRRAVASKLISIDHALILARLGEADQDEHLKWCLNTQAGVKEKLEDVIARCETRAKEASGGKHFGYWEPQSVLDLKDHVESYAGRKLSRAPWKLDDADLVPEVGACEGCPSNTKSNRTLFDDLAIDKATCANSSCFESKRAVFVEIALGKAAQIGEAEGVKISWKPSEAAPRMLKDGSGPNLALVLRKGQWVEAKKGSCAHARMAATVDWSDNDRWSDGRSLRKPGELLLVCAQPKCKAHSKSYETRAKRSNGGYDPKAEEEKREKMRLAAIAETKIRVAVASAAIEKIVKLPAEVLRAVVLKAARHCHERELSAILPGFQKKLQTAKVDSADFAKAVALVSTEQLTAWQHGSAQDGRASFQASVKRLGYADVEKAWKELAPKAEKKPAKKVAKKKAVRK